MSDVTQLIHQLQDGDRAASEELLPLVYDELRRLAAAKMSRERLDHTLPPTALVHEAYLRLVGSGGTPSYMSNHFGSAGQWEGRGHFFAAAAEAMRRILVDHARNSRRLKRGGDVRRISLEDIELAWDPKYGDILDLSDALERLAAVAPETAELVKLRCFAGQTFPEAAALLGISLRTAKRRWAFGRAWLYQAMREEGSESDHSNGNR